VEDGVRLAERVIEAVVRRVHQVRDDADRGTWGHRDTAVDPHHPLPAAGERLDHVRPDEAGGAGDDHGHVAGPFSTAGAERRLPLPDFFSSIPEGTP
jgi:hypothetical protein